MTDKFIFDVDGTLTPSRGAMDPLFKEWFLEFCRNNLVYLVTGSDRTKTLEQVGIDVYNLCTRVYQCSGNEVWIKEDTIRSSSWLLPEDAHEWLSIKLIESDFSIRSGLHFEHRTGMCNFSIVGRNADSIDRGKYVRYEEENGERGHIAQGFNKLFPELQATVGGETGIDIAPRGSDKSQILRDFVQSDTIQFYGDAMHTDGNDYPLATALSNGNYQGDSFGVTGWQDTWERLIAYTTHRT